MDNEIFLQQLADHSPILYKCSLCGLIIQKKLQMIHHLKGHNSKILFCPACPKGFETKQQHVKHFELHHVSREKRNKETLHHHSRSFKCSSCDKSFKSDFYLKVHGQLIHTREIFICTGCRGRFPRKHANQKTCEKCLEMPPPETTFSCNVCGKVFKQKFYQVKHEKTHDPNYKEPEIECKKCKGKFKTTGKYNRHRPCNFRKYMCEVCGKYVSSEVSLKDHMLLHTGERPYICEVCGKSFNKRSSLRVHTVVHTKEKPHPCHMCDKRFTQRNSLKLHIRSVHTGEKPYACIKCEKRFVSKTALNTHQKFHN